jgi:hypothetical protein
MILGLARALGLGVVAGIGGAAGESDRSEEKQCRLDHETPRRRAPPRGAVSLQRARRCGDEWGSSGAERNFRGAPAITRRFAIQIMVVLR